MTKRILCFIGLVIFWMVIIAYLWFWGFIFNFFERLFKSGDPLGWSAVIAMFVVLYTGLLIYMGIGFIMQKIKKR